MIKMKMFSVCVSTIWLLLLCCAPNSSDAQCKSTVTTVKGSHAPTGQICSGQLLLNEDFNQLNNAIWKNEIAMGGGGNNEFQWYVNDRNNSFIENGNLVLRPTLTVDVPGINLERSHVQLNPCTNPNWNGCAHQATPENIVKPIRSGRVHTDGSFSFKYGVLEVRAKLPAGDWLWPAIWLLPQDRAYGDWPRSGEIDLLESRGNRNYWNHEGKHIGVENFGSTLHFGPRWDQNGWSTATFDTRTAPGQGYDKDFHKYKLEWTPSHIRVFLDDRQVGEILVGNGFWRRGGFPGDNIWASGSAMAPFDREFYLIMNLAVGGTNGFFPDAGNQGGKPWGNSQPFAHTAFWRGRQQWLDTWKLPSRDSALVIDYVKIWAL